MAKVTWTRSALAQLDSILDYIALDKPDAARKVASQVFDATNHLERFVGLGRPIPEFPHENYRQVWIKPCWLYYRFDEEIVTILHVRRAEKPLQTTNLTD
jgi:toxin ParE1/3/4